MRTCSESRSGIPEKMGEVIGASKEKKIRLARETKLERANHTFLYTQ